MSENFQDKSIEYYQQSSLYEYIEEDHPMMRLARRAAIKYSLTPTFPIGVIIVNDGEVISESANGNGYHEKNLNTPGHRGGCIRRYISKEREKKGEPKLKSGEGFELCPGCSTDYHAEARAIAETKDKSKLRGAELFMYGHWWCCKDCWDKMNAVGIKKVYAIEKFRDKKFQKKWVEEFKKERACQKNIK